MSLSTSNGNNRITLEKAKEMTYRYHGEKDAILKPEYAGRNILISCETYGREAFDSLLAQSDCVGVRIYFGMDENLSLRAILVGYNSEGQDILPTSASSTLTASGSEGEGGVIVEDGVICPPVCRDSPLLP